MNSICVETSSQHEAVYHRARARKQVAACQREMRPSEPAKLAAQYKRLLKLCRERGCSLEDAEEVVQEAHLRLFQFQRRATVRDKDSLLRRIVINLCINYWRRGSSALFKLRAVDKRDRRKLLADPAPGPERTLAAEQHLDTAVRLLSTVSDRTCQIFIAQRSGYSYEEIATAFAIKPRTVEKHVATAASIVMESYSQSATDVMQRSG